MGCCGLFKLQNKLVVSHMYGMLGGIPSVSSLVNKTVTLNLCFIFSICAAGVPQAGYTMFVRFSSQLNNVLESGDLDGAIENIENVVSTYIIHDERIELLCNKL